MSHRFRLRMATADRDPERFPSGGDDPLGESLFSAAAGSLARGLPRPALLLLRELAVEQVDVVPLLVGATPEGQRMLAALAGQEGIDCAAMVGTLTVTAGGRPLRAVVVYVEWPDNRWWTAWQPVDATGNLVGDGPVVRRAVDGWPRPGGVGGWFARARRDRLHLKIERPAAAEPVVH